MRQLQPRDLVWDGCLNVHELGGLPTADGGEPRFGARLQRMAQTPSAVMAGVFSELERRYGGVEAYLREAGVTDEELELVRERLRG